MNMKHINYIILSAVLTLCAACGQSSTIQSEVQTNDSILPFVNKVVSSLAEQ